MRESNDGRRSRMSHATGLFVFLFWSYKFIFWVCQLGVCFGLSMGFFWVGFIFFQKFKSGWSPSPTLPSLALKRAKHVHCIPTLHIAEANPKAVPCLISCLGAPLTTMGYGYRIQINKKYRLQLPEVKTQKLGSNFQLAVLGTSPTCSRKGKQ